jgi:TPR repeat protein
VNLFINYRREDTRHAAGRLYDRLIQRFGEDKVFMDIDQIDPGEDFVDVINAKVGTCDVAIVAIGPNWLGATDASGKRRLDNKNDFVRMEIVAALQRKIRVIPVLVDGAQMPQKQDLPKALARLARRHAIELSETRFHADVNRLIEAIEKSFAVVEKKSEDLPEPRLNTGDTVDWNLHEDQRSVRLLQIGADLGDAVAQFNLGSLYYHGDLVPKDLFKAAELYQKAADQGHASAQYHLGRLYHFGQGVPKDLFKAAEFYQKAADQGDAGAQCNLGWLYHNGQGVPKDLENARELYQKAADQGQARAQSNLGLLYHFGQGVPKDSGKAAEFFQKAANQGDAEAQYNLGWLYESGQGVSGDLKNARELYQKAAIQGYEPAITRLKLLST